MNHGVEQEVAVDLITKTKKGPVIIKKTVSIEIKLVRIEIDIIIVFGMHIEKRLTEETNRLLTIGIIVMIKMRISAIELTITKHHIRDTIKIVITIIMKYQMKITIQTAMLITIGVMMIIIQII